MISNDQELHNSLQKLCDLLDVEFPNRKQIKKMEELADLIYKYDYVPDSEMITY